MRKILLILFIVYSTMSQAQSIQELSRLDKIDYEYSVCAGMVSGHSQALLLYGYITEEQFWDVARMATMAYFVNMIE